jgi:hypothetical protein
LIIPINSYRFRIIDAKIEAVYRSLVGRSPSPDEIHRARTLYRDDLELAGLIGEIERSEEGLDYAMTRGVAATRNRLRLDYEAGAGAGAEQAFERFVFLHIMKVGGTSLSDLLTGWVGVNRARLHVFVDDLVLLPPPMLRRLRLISGHIPYEALSVIPQPFSTICVLRDPFQRTLSHYRDLRANEPTLAELTLDEFVSSDRFDVPSGNYQARQLAHQIDIANAWLSFSPEEDYRARGGSPEQLYPLQALFDSTSVSLDEAQLLETALWHLDDVTYVGVTDDLDALGRCLARGFQVPDQPVPRLNQSASRERGDLSDAVRKRIDAGTAVDRELYQAAVRRSRLLSEHQGA